MVLVTSIIDPGQASDLKMSHPPVDPTEGQVRCLAKMKSFSHVTGPDPWRQRDMAWDPSQELHRCTLAWGSPSLPLKALQMDKRSWNPLA